MNALYQRLKELDPKTFEQFCFHLLSERHPGGDIKHVAGSGGDEGIDCFAGEIEGKLFIWQAKSFPDGIRESQKTQIRKSLKQAAANEHLRSWVLCLSVDMDVKAHRWFERLKISYKDKLQIGLLDASQIVHELMHRRTLRETYFPGAILNGGELRSLITRTGELSNEELASLSAENVHQYIQRLKDRDARFTYEINFGGDRGLQSPMPRPGLIASVADQNKRIDIYARDSAALQLDPPKISFTVKGTGIEKMMDVIQTGRPQYFGPDELVSFHNDLAFVAGDGESATISLHITPSVIKQEIPMRMTFGTGNDAVVYDHVKFEITRQGTDETELASTGDLPFRLRLVIHKTGWRINFSTDFTNREVRSIQKIVRASEACRMTGYLELYDLDRELPIRGNIAGLPEWDPQFQGLIDDLVFVAGRYHVNLRLPSRMSQEDMESLVVLNQLARGGLATGGDLSVTIVKGTENKDAFPNLLSGSEVGIRLNRPAYEPAPTLFGVTIQTGPIVAQADRARVKNPDVAQKAYDAAKDGDDIELTLEHADKFLIKLSE